MPSHAGPRATSRSRLFSLVLVAPLACPRPPVAPVTRQAASASQRAALARAGPCTTSRATFSRAHSLLPVLVLPLAPVARASLDKWRACPR
ncbi:hypothetical protein FS749_013294 [Ceratobasidium sp. UAMH 11750]|nr:hypothetical protein FS749_013294 [Ceratobasidium sp. UAMH 11750]